jgi:hypothetical protein
MKLKLPHERNPPFNTATRTIKQRYKKLPKDWTAERRLLNVIYAGQIVALKSKTPDHVIESHRTYVSNSLVSDATKGVFANTDIKKGEKVCFFTGYGYASSYAKNGDYSITLPNGTVVDPLDENRDVIEVGKVHFSGTKNGETYDLLVHGALLNEPTDEISKLKKTAAKLKYIGGIGEFVGKTTSVSEENRKELKEVMLFPNVYVNGSQLKKRKKSSSKKELLYLPVYAHRDILKNEELLLCYGANYDTNRSYTASDCKLAEFDDGMRRNIL